jgi:hypothetical protein
VAISLTRDILMRIFRNVLVGCTSVEDNTRENQKRFDSERIWLGPTFFWTA